MSKIILEFDGIEEQDEARTALDGIKWKSAMFDLDMELRKVTKYDTSLLHPDKNCTQQEFELALKLREIIREKLEENGIQFD